MAAELERAVGKDQATRLSPRLVRATCAYEEDRYPEARGLLASIVRLAPGAPTVRELFGLCLYREGRWAAALRQLEAHQALTGSLDQYPVMADCHRALDHHDRVRALWDELRLASPSPEVVAEGRIVMAATLADGGDLAGAVGLLERSLRSARVVRPHQVRQWYALADLYERAGELARARELFARVLRHDPELSDARQRLIALG